MSYLPAPQMMLHCGEPIPAEMEFFCGPAPEIGAVVSGQSSLKHGQEPKAMGLRLGIAAAVFVAFVVGCAWYVYSLPPKPGMEHLLFGAAVGAITGLLAGALVMYVTGFRHSCSFVGDQGVMRATLKGSKENAPKVELFRFSQATDLFASQTHQYVNGVYSSTQLAYVWKDADGKKVFGIHGPYNKNKVAKQPQSILFFAASAEIAWNELQLGAIKEQVEQFGVAQFKVNSNDYVAVGTGFLEFTFGKNTTRLAVDQIDGITLDQGMFSVRSKDAKWYSGKGKFSFAYGNMANARLFLLVLEKLCGLKFG